MPSPTVRDSKSSAPSSPSVRRAAQANRTDPRAEVPRPSRRTPPHPRLRSRLRSSAFALFVFAITTFARPAAAGPAPAIVEIDPRVELDGRTVRRLVQLEL